MNSDNISEIVSRVVAELSGKMTLSLAETLSKCVEKKAREMGVTAVIAVTDSGARPILIHSMDDAYIASFDIALKKAYTVVSLKMPTKKLAALARPDGSLYGIQYTNSGQIVIFGGGDPLVLGGKIVGGIGVSGGTEEQDTELSAYGATVFEEIWKNFRKDV